MLFTRQALELTDPADFWAPGAPTCLTLYPRRALTKYAKTAFSKEQQQQQHCTADPLLRISHTAFIYSCVNYICYLFAYALQSLLNSNTPLFFFSGSPCSGILVLKFDDPAKD